MIVVALEPALAGAVADHVRLLLAADVRVVLVRPDAAAASAARAALPDDPRLEIVALVPDERRLLLARLLPGRIYRAVVRPWLLGRRWRSLRRRVDVAGAGRVVAADLAATTLVWHLARRYPTIVATTALDRPAEALRRDQ